MSHDSPFAKRLKEARERAGLSQRKLGILAGFPKDSASTRVNQYERGKYEPRFHDLKAMAKVMETPTAFFYAQEDEVAEMILLADGMAELERKKVLKELRDRGTDQ